MEMTVALRYEYWIMTSELVGFVDKPADFLGGMWAVIAFQQKENDVNNTATRIEKDSLGEVKVAADALKLGFVTEEEFDRVVDPAKMVKPYVAAAG